MRADYRGRGLAGRLVNCCIQWARENQLKLVEIAAVDSNTAAIRCYTRCGFSVYGRDPKALFHDNTYYDELLMSQEL